MGLDAVVDVRLCDLELGLQLGDEELVVLERADGLTKCLALLGIGDRLDQDLLRMSDVGHGRAHSLLGKLLHHRDEAPVDLTDDVGAGDAHVGEEELGGV